MRRANRLSRNRADKLAGRFFMRRISRGKLPGHGKG